MRAFTVDLARFLPTSPLLLLALLSGPTAGRADDVCRTDADCDDGIFCNGVESCRPGNRSADRRGCVRGVPPDCDDRNATTADSCDETHALCRHDLPDADGDGHALGRDDCDDADPHRYPGNAEVCDAEGHDEDCNPETIGTRDEDGDGHVDAACWNDLSRFPVTR